MTKEKIRQICLKTAKAAGGLCLFLMPVLSYILFEYVTGNLWQIPFRWAILNIGWFYALYLILFGLLGSTRIAVPLSSLIFLALSLAEAFVVSFRDRPIMLWDVLALRTAMTVSGNYAFHVSGEMIRASLCIFAANLIVWFVPVRLKGRKKRLLGAGGCLTGAGLYCLLFFSVIIPGKQLGINMWAVNETYEEFGYVLSTAVSAQYIVKKPPTGYSRQRLEKIYNRMQETEDEEASSGNETANQSKAGAIRPVNLICIMNESLSDLRADGSFTTNQEYFPFISRLSENTVKGQLCMPVFGSMTSNSEFEFLTGDSMALLPANSIAYQFNVKPKAYSMVSTVKAQGYRTVAMHPYPGENWNRNVCYQNMGFDKFLDGDYYKGAQEIRNYVSDQADFEKLIQVIEEKESPEDKLFLFNVTMQNHGGYEGSYDNFTQEIELTGDMAGKYPKTDQYLSLVKRSDEAFEYLVRYFSQCDQPTMIVMFGDHQPSVEDEFFDEIAGVPSDQVPAADRLMWYETPFIIWTNYDQPSADMGKLGAVYLSSYVLKLANLELTPYNRFLLALSEQFPVLHFLGLYDRAGGYYSWPQAESQDFPFREMLLDYEALVYNHSLDRKKYEPVFTLKEK